jgi:hypothetical protein
MSLDGNIVFPFRLKKNKSEQSPIAGKISIAAHYKPTSLLDIVGETEQEINYPAVYRLGIIYSATKNIGVLFSLGNTSVDAGLTYRFGNMNTLIKCSYYNIVGYKTIMCSSFYFNGQGTPHPY